MASLIYTALMSLDGYIEDEQGTFDFAAPDEEVHSFINDLERPVTTNLLGRRLYEVMSAWDDPQFLEGQPPHILDFASIWQASEKIVYSRTLTEPSTPKTRIEREFDPEAVRRLKASAPGDLEIGGAELAAQAFAAGLVDECHVFLAPVLVGGGKPGLPHKVRVPLELQEERRFNNGMVFLRYRCLPRGDA